MQNEVAAVYTRFTSGRPLSQRGAGRAAIAPYWCGRRVPLPLEAAPLLVRVLGTSRATGAVSVARDGLLLALFREPVRAFTKDLHGAPP